MSKWTDVRDNIVDALHVDDVTEDVKQHVTSTILSEVVPVAENAVDSFCTTTKEQSKTEAGWCKIRDGMSYRSSCKGASTSSSSYLARPQHRQRLAMTGGLRKIFLAA